MKVLVRATVF